MESEIAGKGNTSCKFGEVNKKEKGFAGKSKAFHREKMQVHVHNLHDGKKLNEALLAKTGPFRYPERRGENMDSKQIGELLSRLRKEQNMTQQQVAEALCVSPQAVSKWERGRGCPDISLLPELSTIFGVALGRLLMGDLAPEGTEVGNMKRIKFYVCPDCGNILTATGGGELHCCGRRLEPLAAKVMDDEHRVRVQEIEEDWYVTFEHPMKKDHFFRFAAYVAVDRVLLTRLYPEQGGEFRIPQIRGGGKLYLCCSRDGLFEVPKK